jgi:tryptophan synthase alpha subunit
MEGTIPFYSTSHLSRPTAAQLVSEAKASLKRPSRPFTPKTTIESIRALKLDPVSILPPSGTPTKTTRIRSLKYIKSSQNIYDKLTAEMFQGFGIKQPQKIHQIFLKIQKHNDIDVKETFEILNELNTAKELIKMKHELNNLFKLILDVVASFNQVQILAILIIDCKCEVEIVDKLLDECFNYTIDEITEISGYFLGIY